MSMLGFMSEYAEVVTPVEDGRGNRVGQLVTLSPTNLHKRWWAE